MNDTGFQVSDSSSCSTTAPRPYDDASAAILVALLGSYKVSASLRTGCLRVRYSLQPSPHVFDFRRPNRRLNSHWLAEAIGN